jgi:nucleotide-binding universal stress UspA family protein
LRGPEANPNSHQHGSYPKDIRQNAPHLGDVTAVEAEPNPARKSSLRASDQNGHGSAGRHIAEFAGAHQAEMIVIGTPGYSEIAEIFDASLTSELVHNARWAVHIVAPLDEHKLSRAGVADVGATPSPGTRHT